MKSFAILVHACDRYELLFKGFEHFFAKNWDFNVPCSYYFRTENVHFSSTLFKNIRTGSGEWSDRLKLLLDDIEADYILLFQEDMWLCKPVGKRVLKALLKYASENEIGLLKLHSSDCYNTVPTPVFIEGLNISMVDKLKSNFLMSHQVSIWNKQLLKSLLPNGEHPWRNERKGSLRLKKNNDVIYQIDLFSLNGKLPNNKNNSNQTASGYFTISVNAKLNEFAPRFFDELRNETNATLKDYGERLAYHHHLQMTHDGKPEPRKIDFFKRAKNLFKNY